MDAASDIAGFLSTRRARVTPEQVGLPAYGARRVNGLRREEVASLAGISIDYYRRLERGSASGASEGVLSAPLWPANGARFMLLDPVAREFYVDWERNARDLVAYLRAEAARDPHDRGLSDLVGELATGSPEFAAWWATHNVRHHRSGSKRMRHPLVGELDVDYEVMDVAADAGLTIVVYSSEPGSRSAEQLALLGSWAATPDSPVASLNEQD